MWYDVCWNVICSLICTNAIVFNDDRLSKIQLVLPQIRDTELKLLFVIIGLPLIPWKKHNLERHGLGLCCVKHSAVRSLVKLIVTVTFLLELHVSSPRATGFSLIWVKYRSITIIKLIFVFVFSGVFRKQVSDSYIETLSVNACRIVLMSRCCSVLKTTSFM